MDPSHGLGQIVAIGKKAEAKAGAGGGVAAEKPIPVHRRVAVRKAIEAHRAVAA